MAHARPSLPSPAVKKEIEPQQLPCLADDGGQPGLAGVEVVAHGLRLVGVELRQLGLDAGGHRRRSGAARLGVLAQCRRRLQLLALAHVGQVEDGLGRERAEVAQSVRRCCRGRHRAGRAALAQGGRRAHAATRPRPPSRPGPTWPRGPPCPAAARPARGRRRAALSRSSPRRRRGPRGPRGGRPARRRAPGPRAPARRSRGCWPGTGCPAPRPRALRAPARRCRGTRSSRGRSAWRGCVAATRSSRSSGTGTTATLGSTVVNG